MPTKLMPFACHRAFYSGKVVVIDYEPNVKQQFRRACQRIADNCGEGYVITPKGEIYAISRSSRLARYVNNVFDVQTILAAAEEAANNPPRLGMP